MPSLGTVICRIEARLSWLARLGICQHDRDGISHPTGQVPVTRHTKTTLSTMRK